MKTRILLIDDHRIMRDGIKLILRNHPAFEVVGEVGDGMSALEAAEKVKPELAVVDLGLPRLGGLELIRCLRDRFPAVKLLILSGEAEEYQVREAVRLGVSSYLLKVNAGAELVQALQAVACGNAYFSPEVAVMLAQGYRKVLAETSASPLSDRERQILTLVAEGRNTKEIAHALTISAKTVEAHRKHIMDKLGLFSVAELTKYALREGLTKL